MTIQRITVFSILAAMSIASVANAGKYDPVTVRNEAPRHGLRSMRHASTVHQGYLDGTANVIGSIGEATHDVARARVENQRARRLAIENNFKSVVTWHAQRQHRANVVHAERRARAEARKTQASYAQPTVDASAWFDSSGNIQWPAALSANRFTKQRVDIELAMNNGEMITLQQAASTLRTALRGDIRELSPRDYLAAKRFLVYLESSNVDTPTVLVAANR